MKKKYLVFFFLLLLFGQKSKGQKQEKRLNFILTIDKEIPIAKIFDGYFLITKKAQNIRDTFKFQYQVGTLLLSSSDYENLFSLDSTSTIKIKFKYIKFSSNQTQIYSYEKVLRDTWVNEVYIILNVFNYFDAESRKKYFIRKDQYVIQIQVPGGGNVIAKRK